jgi:hypothetical protein
MATQEKEGLILDHIFSFNDFETLCYASKVYTTAIATTFSTDAAGAELIGYWRVRFHAELHGAALAASFKFPGDIL